MELTSSKNDTWKYFAAGSFAGFFLLLLLAYQTHPYTSLLAAPNSIVDLSPLLGHIDAANASPAANPALQDRADDLGEAGGAKTSTAPKPVLQGPADDLGEAGAADSSTAAKPVLQGPADDLGETDAENTSTAAKPVVQGPDDDLGETDAANTSTVAEPVLQGTSDGSIAAKLVLQDSADSFDTDGMNLNITVKESEKKSEKKCDIFEGKWVYKPEEDPGYDSVRCPFIEEKMSCRKNGRPDFEYENWRWEARDCDIPVFNGTYMLERLRNKRVILAGDSLNRNMWESLACLLYSSIPSSTVEVQAVNPVYKVLKAKEYNCTVEFYWSPFLVEFVEKHVSGKKVLVLDKLSQNSMQWLGADVMVFNSGHWWLHGGKMKSWDVFEYEGKLVEEMPIELAYERAMTTWAKWMKKKNIDPRKTKVFFRSLSAVHQTSQDWCYNATQPITDDSYITQAHHSDTLVEVIKRVIKGIKKIPVKYLNISKLSQYRRDAHPSIYRSSQWKVLIKKFEDNLAGYADCSHWCLPGLPDTWNRLLYASLLFDANVDNFSS